MVLSSSGGSSRANRAPVTYGKARRSHQVVARPTQKTSSLTSLPDTSSEYSSTDDESDAGREVLPAPAASSKILKQSTLPWKRIQSESKEQQMPKRHPLEERPSTVLNAQSVNPPARPSKATSKPSRLKEYPKESSVERNGPSRPLPFASSSSALSSPPSLCSSSSSSSRSRKAGLAAQRRVRGILEFERQSSEPKRLQEASGRHTADSTTSNAPEAGEKHKTADGGLAKLQSDFQVLSVGSTPPSSSSFEDLLQVCEQRQPASFEKTLASMTAAAGKDARVECAGEASYSHVLRFHSNSRHSSSTILKIVPLLRQDRSKERSHDVEASQCADVCREIAITRQLAQLEGSHFANLVGAKVVQGNLPDLVSSNTQSSARRSQDHVDKNGGSVPVKENHNKDAPLWAILHLVDSGSDLESCELGNWIQAASIFAQVLQALAMAEQRFEFEHRDLHWGNVLVAETDASSDAGADHDEAAWKQLIDAPSSGVKATIIDFTLSRLQGPNDGKRSGKTLFYDLSRDAEVFKGEAKIDEQFEVYRSMRKLVGSASEKNGQGSAPAADWSLFEPATNLVWMHYLVRKLLFESGLRPLSSPASSSATGVHKAKRPQAISKSVATQEQICYERLAAVEQMVGKVLNQRLFAVRQSESEEHPKKKINSRVGSAADLRRWVQQHWT